MPQREIVRGQFHTDYMAAIVKLSAPRHCSRLVAVLGVGTMLITAGCSSPQNMVTTLPAVATDSMREVPVVVPMPGGAPVAVPGAPPVGDLLASAESGAGMDSGFVGSPGEVSLEVVTNPADREIIVVGSAQLEADDPVATSGQIAAYVESIGGNISSRREWRATNWGAGGASLSLRIPAGSLNSVIDRLSQFGAVTSINVDQWDVTEQAVDLDARIAALQTSVTRLTELLATAGDTGDLLQVERELSRRQADLDSLRAQRADLTGRVQMSSLEVNIVPTPDAERLAEPYQGFFGGLQRGWRALVSFARGFAIVFGAVLPWLAALGVLTALIIPLVRWLRRRFAARQSTRPVRYDREAQIFTEDDD